jgi:hypothetical protein
LLSITRPWSHRALMGQAHEFICPQGISWEKESAVSPAGFGSSPEN